jgi:hypothetical protein
VAFSTTSQDGLVEIDIATRIVRVHTELTARSATNDNLTLSPHNILRIVEFRFGGLFRSDHTP